MLLLELTLPSLPLNLALDEALLEQSEAGQGWGELLRFWESPHYGVVLGRSSRVDVEVNTLACARQQIDIQRRCSGGATVAVGPGCLMYALLLDYTKRPELRDLAQCHAFVMQGMLTGIRSIVPQAQFQGTCDLTLHGRKFSGNALRCRRRFLLYHGCLLYDFPLQRLQEWLGTPPRTPDYRMGRSHEEFVTNLPTGGAALRSALIRGWQAKRNDSAETGPYARALAEAERLCVEKYTTADWIHGK